MNKWASLFFNKFNETKGVFKSTLVSTMLYIRWVMNRIQLVFFTVILCLGSQLFAQKGVIISSPQVFEQLMSSGNEQLLDVRTQDEFNAGHLEGAINIDIWSPSFMKEVKSRFDRSKPLLIYCAGGGRSAMAAEDLSKKGFKLIYDLEGGIESFYSGSIE